MTKKQTALVVCPGRGTYNKEELGYFKTHHADRGHVLSTIDAVRREQGQIAIADLDGADRFNMKEHTRGDNASALIYACAYADFLSINRDKYDIVAVTGNSMGWYIALACAGVVDLENGARIINTMGTFMQDSLIGGQLIYGVVDEQWHEISGAREEIHNLVEEIDGLYASIYLGGMFVFGGRDDALAALEKRLSPRGRFPFRLINHAAFHTPLQEPVSQKALSHFRSEIMGRPSLPLVDGRGVMWSPYATGVEDIFEYTFSHQVVRPYDFTSSIQVAVKEYAPDKVIILGPGMTLGGAVAQSLIDIKWKGITSKDEFGARQSSDPFILSMGMEDQRSLVL